MSARQEREVHDQEFWEARSFARNSILTTILALVFTVSSLDRTAPLNYILNAFCALPVLYVFAMTMTSRVKEILFSYFIALLSIAQMLHFLESALRDINDLSEYPHATDRSMMLRMHRHGQIPPPVNLFLVLPCLAIPAGMTVGMAKKVSILSFLILCGIMVAIYNNIGKELARSTTCSAAASHETDQFDHDLIFVDFYQDCICSLVTLSFALFTCFSGAEVTETHMNLLRAGRHADSLLNHVLKNQIAGAAAVIEIFIQTHPDSKSELQGACDQLYQSMSWCAIRQTMLDLAAGVYKSTLTPIRIRRFLEGLKSPAVPFEISDNEGHEISNPGVPTEVMFDKKMALLAMENIISNAVAHGDSTHPIRLTFDISDEASSCGAACSVVFTIENRIPPGVELTNAMLQKLGHSTSATFHPENDAPLNTAESNIPASSSGLKTANSTNSGLKHLSLACKGAGGSFEIYLGKAGKSVVVRLVLPAQRLVGTALDQRRPVTPLPTHGRAIATLNLRICCLDDTQMICKGYQKLLLPLMEADMQLSTVICPKTSEEVDLFFADVIGGRRGDRSGDREETLVSTPALTPADVVILDQNIDLKGTENGTIHGTDLALKLRTSGFKGLIVLRSGNSSVQNIQEYTASGAVDACLGKDGNHRELAAQILAAYARKFHAQNWP